MPLPMNNLEIYQRTSSQKTRQDTLRHSHLRMLSLSHPGLISERELVTTFSLTKSQMSGVSCPTFNPEQSKLSLPPNVHHHCKRRHAHRDAQKQTQSKCILSVQESERTRYYSRKTPFFSWRYCTIPIQIAPQEQTRSIHNYA